MQCLLNEHHLLKSLVYLKLVKFYSQWQCEWLPHYEHAKEQTNMLILPGAKKDLVTNSAILKAEGRSGSLNE